nr:tetraspanin [Hymenolepis microstoma]
MELTCGEQCLRVLLVVCNLLVFIFSTVCAGFAAYILARVKEVTDDNNAIVSIAIVLAVVLFTLVLSFFGCCGAWKLNNCMLKTVKDYADAYVKQLIYNVEVSGSVEAEGILRSLQEKLECCGATSEADWKDPKIYCCPRDKPNCQVISGKGCVNVIYDYLKGHSVVAGILVLVLAVVEIGAIVAACCLAKNHSV